MVKKRLWFLLFIALFLGAFWAVTRTGGVSLRALYFPHFVYAMISFQLLLAVCIWGFAKDVWTPEMQSWERELAANARKQANAAKTSGKRS